MEEFSRVTEAWSKDIITWANPNLKEPVTAGWAFTRLDHALLALAPYLLVIIAGIIRYEKPKPRGKGPKKEADTRSFGEVLSSLEPLKLLMLLYNVVQVVLCTWMCVMAGVEAYKRGFSLICNEFNEKEEGLATVLWVFYLSKILDFLDTFFIVVRGGASWNQFSFLHTYHHVTIFLVYWLNANAGFDGDIYFTVVANSFVHAVMYSYYAARILGIEIKNKHLVTQLQMFQFVCMISQAAYILVNGCPFPTNITKMYLIYIISLFGLFAYFYYLSYVAAGKARKEKAKQKTG